MFRKKNKLYRRYKKKVRSSTRRKYINKRRNAIKSYLLKGPKGMIFPDNYTCKLRYNYLTTFTGPASEYLQMRVNGPYDPYAGIGGGQPMGYDQLTALYVKHVVNSCSIKIRASNLSSVPAYLICYPLTNASAPAGLQNDLEQRYSKNTLISGVGAKAVGYLNHYIDVNKLFGEKHLDDTFEALSTTVPTNCGYWNISAYSVDTSTLNMPISIEITYYVTFKDPVRLGTS